MVLLSSPFWVAWLAVILNQQGGLSGAEGSAEGEVCVCLFVVLHIVTFVHFCLVVLRIQIDIVLYFALDFYFSKCLILCIACAFSPYILNFTFEGGGFFVCLRHFFHFIFYLDMRRKGLCLILYVFLFFMSPWYEEGRSMFDFVYVCLFFTLV